MKMNTLSENQKKRLNFWNKTVVPMLPQIEAPSWFIKYLSNILPHNCPFYRTYFYKGKLLLFIPSLCPLNPFYEEVMRYRYKNINII